MYKSPITILESTIDSFYKSIIKQKDDAIFAEIQSSFGVDIDRQELIRALNYDRNQYDKGYADGKRDALDSIVHCKDCKFMVYPTGMCAHPRAIGWDALEPEDDDFCSCGERRTE